MAERKLKVVCIANFKMISDELGEKSDMLAPGSSCSSDRLLSKFNTSSTLLIGWAPDGQDQLNTVESEISKR